MQQQFSEGAKGLRHKLLKTVWYFPVEAARQSRQETLLGPFLSLLAGAVPALSDLSPICSRPAGYPERTSDLCLLCWKPTISQFLTRCSGSSFLTFLLRSHLIR